MGSHQLQGVMTVTSTILCHCVHTSSVVTSTYMIPCSIVRLCSGVLLFSKQHCLFSCVICILLFSGICSCHRCECVFWDSDNIRWWRRYSCHHHFSHQMEEQEEGRGTYEAVGETMPCSACTHTTHTQHTHTHTTHTYTHCACIYSTYSFCSIDICESRQ